MAIIPHAEQHEIESVSGQVGTKLRLIGQRRLVGRFFSKHAKYIALRDRHMGTQSRECHLVVAAQIIRWHAALVAEVDIYPAPVDATGIFRCRQPFIHGTWCIAPCECDCETAALGDAAYSLLDNEIRRADDQCGAVLVDRYAWLARHCLPLSRR